MKVKFLTSIAGPNWSARPKQIVEVQDAFGLRAIAAGIAVAVEEPKPEPPAKVETATAPKPETATKPKPTKK